MSGSLPFGNSLEGPVITDLNNGVLSGVNAMPTKNNSTSDGTADFEVSRKIYSKTVMAPNFVLKPPTNTNFPANVFTGNKRSLSGRINNVTNGAPIQAPPLKKWLNSNRDASQITTNRRVAQVGVGSLNASGGNTSFLSKNDPNVRIDALTRVRGGGSVVPPKVRAQKFNTFTFF